MKMSRAGDTEHFRFGGVEAKARRFLLDGSMMWKRRSQAEEEKQEEV
jgi:hypothetical protein